VRHAKQIFEHFFDWRMASSPGEVDDETRRSDFNAYLTKNNVDKQLTAALLRMYNEESWPEKPLHYIRQYLGAPPGSEMQDIQEEIEDLRFKNEELEATIDALMNQLENFQRDPDAD
jgi:hypothetical protein